MAALKKSFLFSFLEQASSKFVSIIVQIVLARLLTPENFGVMAIILVVVGIGNVFAQNGLSNSLIQTPVINSVIQNTAFWVCFIFAIITYIVIFIIAPLVSQFYQIDDLSSYMRFVGLIILTDSFNSIQRVSLQREMEFDKLFAINLIAAVVSGVIGILMALHGFGIWALIVQTIAVSVIACLGMFFVVKWKPGLSFSCKDAFRLLSFGWNFCLTGLVNTLTGGITELLIGKTNSTIDLGYYTQGKKYPLSIMTVISAASNNVLFPAFSKLQANKDLLMETFQKVLACGTFVIAPLAFMITLVAEPLVLIFLSEKWAPCIPIFQMVCLPYAFLMFESTNLYAYTALGYGRSYLRVNVIKALVLCILVCSVCVFTKNIYLTAAAFSFSLLVGFVIEMVPAKKKFGFGALAQLKSQLPIFIVCAVSYLSASIINFFELSLILKLCIEVLIFIGIYFELAKVLRLEGWFLMVSTIKKLIKFL